MAKQDDKKVRFIRKNGKVIPIKVNPQDKKWEQGRKLANKANYAMGKSDRYSDKAKSRIRRRKQKGAQFGALGGLAAGIGLGVFKRSALIGGAAGLFGLAAGKAVGRAASGGRMTKQEKAWQKKSDKYHGQFQKAYRKGQRKLGRTSFGDAVGDTRKSYLAGREGRKFKEF